MNDRAAEYLAHRVLEGWCLGDDPMEGEQWEDICCMAGVDPETTAVGATYLRQRMSADERQARLRELAQIRATDTTHTTAMTKARWSNAA